MNYDSLQELAQKLSKAENLIRNLEGYDDYRTDATIETGNPSAVVFAENENDVITVVNFCQSNNIPLVARGAGTGLSGGCVPSDGAIVLSLEKMTNLKIDPVKKIGYAEPGVITKTLLDEAEKHNLTFPPDPASYEESTLGGNVAENAGGLRCKKYGVTRDYVIGIKGVTSDGLVIKTGIYTNSPGFNIEDIFIGSEGTLIIITEIAFRLIDLPQPGVTILAAFDSPKNAAQAVSDICGSGIIPTVLEFIDGDAAECSNRYEENEGLDNAAAILIIEAEAIDLVNTVTICQSCGCVYIKKESDYQKAEQLWKIRRNLSEAVKAIANVRISEDVAVPISQFPILVDFVAQMNKISELRINSFGHAGDGNLHVNFLSMTGSESDRELIEKDIVTLLKKTIELRGTLSGEHGIGLAKKKYLPLEFDKQTLDFMIKFKRIFDENNLINPDKIF